MANQNNLFSEQEIQDILDKDLLELMGAQNMPPEQKQALYKKMAVTVQDRIILRVDDKLDEAGRKEWIQLLDQGDKAKMEEFLKTKNIDIAKILIEEAIIYKTEMMALFKKSQTDSKE